MSENSTCEEFTVCDPGEFIAASGTTKKDQTCEPCTDGFYSTRANVVECNAWQTCEPGYVEVTAGTATTDRECGLPFKWVDEFGNQGPREGFNTDRIMAMGIADDGSIYVGGWTYEPFPDLTPQGYQATFVRKYSAGGEAQWTRVIADTMGGGVQSIVVTPEHNVIVAGGAEGRIENGIDCRGHDGVLRIFDSDGNLGDVRILRTNDSTTEHTGVNAIATAVEGVVYVTGGTNGQFSGEINAGYDDVFVGRLDLNDGGGSWFRQFGSPIADGGASIAYAGDGSVYVVGTVYDALPGQTYLGEADAFIAKYSVDGTRQWIRQFGTGATEAASSVLVGGDGGVYVAGFTDGTLPASPPLPTNSTRRHFLRRYDAGGDQEFTVMLPFTGIGDSDAFLAERGDGAILVAGWRHPLASGLEQFVAAFSPTGEFLGERALGYPPAEVLAFGLTPNGGCVLAGRASGAFPTQTYQADGDAFILELTDW